MDLSNIILPEHVVVPLTSTEKRAAIEELLDTMVASGRVTDRETVLQVVLDREAKLATGMGNGVAIPHGKTNSVDCISAAIGISAGGIAFSDEEEPPCHIVLLTLSPASMVGPHIEFLATITRRLNLSDCREALSACNDAAAVLKQLQA